MAEFVLEEEEVDRPVRYLPIGRLYSPPSSACVNPSGSSKIMSKKVKARKLEEDGHEEEAEKPRQKPLLVYHRRRKRLGAEARCLEANGGEDLEGRKRVKVVSGQVGTLGDGVRKSARLGLSETCDRINYGEARRRSHGSKQKRWARLGFEGVDLQAFIGLACKVFWPIDDEWYKGSVTGFDSASQQHCVEYEDGEIEHLILSNENIKFHVSHEEMECLNLKYGTTPNIEKNVLNHDEILALAVNSFDCQDLEPGDLVWAKLTGYAMWPAIIMNESCVGRRKGLRPTRGDQSVLVQFFGTHDFARINLKQAMPFLNGLQSSLHLKCKQTRFYRSLDEAKTYLSKQQLPERMLLMQRDIYGKEQTVAFEEDEECCSGSEEKSRDKVMQKTFEGKRTPVHIKNLRVISLGRIVCDSDHFHNKQYIWPEGYSAFRRFISMRDPSSMTSYKMEVLRNPKLKTRPLFRVTLDDGEQIDGPTPDACWQQIYGRIKDSLHDSLYAQVEGCDLQKSGSYMFGFSNQKILQLIQGLTNSKSSSKNFRSCQDLPVGYRAVHVEWKDLDKCSVCHMDEEYEDNLFLQCEKCRLMVHARCYGELEPSDGMLWLCNLCRPGAPEYAPPCCLCPVIGGVMKPTTDGRWAHLACAMWIPETCLLDVTRMEPIDGLSRINRDRWKLLCSICGVSYGACIQCSNKTCRVAYHPLCARAAGLCVELEDEHNLLMSLDEDDDQCIRLLSFCKKHSQPSTKTTASGESSILVSQSVTDFTTTESPSRCARSEPYKFIRKRVQKDSQTCSAATVKRYFLENTPFLVTGYRQNGIGCLSSHESAQTVGLFADAKPRITASESFITMAEKYENMKETFRKRLTFGKSRIHGFGVFAKLAHKAGDMVIEYTGELVRSPVADIREHTVYNALIGAGTYMFRIDDERVVDATRAGSIAHLINHSCEPNCFSRIISVNGVEHIIIFAKRDIDQWEELTYDYRYFSTDKQLACNCGYPRCRGVVNDIEAEEQVAKFRVPRCEVNSPRDV